MKAKIKINKKDALLAGLDNQGDYEIEFDPAQLTLEERQELIECDFYVDRRISFKGFSFKNGWRPALDSVHRPVAPTVEELRKVLIDMIRARKEIFKIEADFEEKKKQEALEMAIQWAKRPIEKNLEYNHRTKSYECRLGEPIYKAAKQNNEIREAIEDAQSLCFWVNLANQVDEIKSEAEKAAQKAALLAEQEAIFKRRHAQITAWVAEYGDENMKARHAEGVLSSTEVTDAMRNQLFKPFDGFSRYERLQASDVCNGYEDYEYSGIKYHDVEFTVENEGITLTAKEFEQLRKIHTVAPQGATITPRDHVATCEQCDNTVHRISVKVEIQAGEFRFSREYQLT